MYLVSACLLGIKCRYDGEGMQIDKLKVLAARGQAIPVCPEQLGGCSTPRTPCEIKGGSGGDVLDGKCRVIGKENQDVTASFIRGAQETMKLVSACGVKKAILKARSPSCGVGQIYDGSFSGTIIDGNGVTAELLHRNNIELFSELNFEDVVCCSKILCCSKHCKVIRKTKQA